MTNPTIKAATLPYPTFKEKRNISPLLAATSDHNVKIADGCVDNQQ